MQACNSTRDLVVVRSLSLHNLGNQKELQQLENEAAILRRLNRSGILAYLDDHRDEKGFCLVQVSKLKL